MERHIIGWNNQTFILIGLNCKSGMKHTTRAKKLNEERERQRERGENFKKKNEKLTSN